MRQTAVTFGPQQALVGVLTEPDVLKPEAPVMLLINAGLLPRQGPHRMNVRIARELTEIGMSSFRFDLSGRGDSQTADIEGGDRAQAVRDIKAAMDWLEQSRGTQRFLAFGVCSGAVNIYDLAQTDERVEGIMMFDGFWYRSRWTTIVRYVKQVRAKGWRSALRAVARRILPKPRSPQPEDEAPSVPSEYQGNPPLASFAEVMQHLVDRGVDVNLAYGGSIIEHYSYRAQFKHVFGGYPFCTKVRCSYEPDVDHTFVTKRAQQRMLELLRGWGQSHLPPASAA